MAELMNWPPSRGPNPHTHNWKWEPNATRKDMPAPGQRVTALIEKDIIEGVGKGGLPKEVQPLPQGPFKRHKEQKKPPLVGTWKVWYQVKAVAGLTLEQADDFVLACQDKIDVADHLGNWFGFEPRPLWVDITYPLKRGVRLLVKPLVRESLPCRACKGDRKSTRVEMTPGYFLWMVAKEYERIYKEHAKYGVWGHALEDLWFERVTIQKDGVVDLFIGS